MLMKGRSWKDSRGWRRAKVMHLQARKCQGTKTPSGHAEAWPGSVSLRRGSAARTSISGFRPPGLKDNTYLLCDTTRSVVLGCCSPRGSKRGNSLSSLGCGWGRSESLTRAQPWPFLQLSPAVPQVHVCPGQTRKASSSFWVRTCPRLAESCS